MLNRNRVIGVVLIAAIFVLTVLVAAPAVFAAFAPDVFTVDQPTIDGRINITRATLNEPGWVVIHADVDGAPGPVVGYAPLPAGISANIPVAIDAAARRRRSMPCFTPTPAPRGCSSIPTARTRRCSAATRS
jgi:hypothetical protein